MSRRRVVVTGLGIISPIGNTVADAWSNALAGKSGIGRITRFDPSAVASQIAGEVKDFDVAAYLAPKEARRMDRFIHFGIAAGVQALKDSGLEVTDVSAHTGHPEILGGRVKTLHPRVHGGLLGDPSIPAHRQDLEKAGIEPIALLVVNLYPFLAVAARPEAAIEELIEMIDIGGPAMLRSAAKNHAMVGVVVDPADYGPVADELERAGSPTMQSLRLHSIAGALRALAAHPCAQSPAYRSDVHRESHCHTCAKR